MDCVVCDVCNINSVIINIAFILLYSLLYLCWKLNIAVKILLWCLTISEFNSILKDTIGLALCEVCQTIYKNILIKNKKTPVFSKLILYIFITDYKELFCRFK